MNNQTNNFDEETVEQAELTRLLSEQLNTLPVQPARLSALENRLVSRIKTSIAQHKELITVRAKSGNWHTLSSGIRYKTLWQSNVGNSVLLELAPSACLPSHKHLHLEEGIVLSGSLQHDHEILKPFDYHRSPAGSQHGKISSPNGALAFLRGSSLGDNLAMATEVVTGLWPKAAQTSQSLFFATNTWQMIQPGLSEKILWRDGQITSRYYRLEPETRLVGHDHPFDEECMMLSGEIFLGDILLQAGDYHLAPKGTKHLNVFTDTGALLFVRGAA